MNVLLFRKHWQLNIKAEEEVAVMSKHRRVDSKTCVRLVGKCVIIEMGKSF